ncbi:MAG: pantoate--beta-alanine ligase [Clostridiaceae bacterium]|nr:pantoate--beta-alanine ligase [Clostridiaceae bacterium]
MKIIKTKRELREELNKHRKENKTIGFVPTMGYLHEGHLSLIRKSAQENDITVVSIFVNPTQFGPNEDFEKYPRDLERDAKLAESAGADYIFNPEVSEMYPEGYLTYCYVKDITKKLCGKSRPTHFEGVTTVCLKLFNIVRPNRAYFGQKDAQQLAVIKRMVKDLDLELEIVPCPIVRDYDNLALSSRNVYLSQEERKEALCLSKSLFEAKRMIDGGERDSAKIKEKMKKIIGASKLAKIDYVEIVDADTLEDNAAIKDNTLIAVAAYFGSTRLIDNIIIHF